MSQLDDVLSRIKTHEGVEHIFLLGGDGLLVRHIGEPRTLEVDTVSPRWCPGSEPPAPRSAAWASSAP
jgi:hypothetical protein